MSIGSYWVPIAAIFVGLVNVALNFWIRSAAQQSDSVIDNILSAKFLTAFFLGLVSLSCLFFLYSLKADLGRAILLAGAVSILGGCLFSMLHFNIGFTVSEKAILFLIAAFYVMQFLK